MAYPEGRWGISSWRVVLSGLTSSLGLAEANARLAGNAEEE